MNYIRKISVGSDYKNAMHYIVGQEVLGGSYLIDSINFEEKGYSVWVKKDGEVVKWKEVTNTPVMVEYNLNAI
jgi:hypothetical protein